MFDYQPEDQLFATGKIHVADKNAIVNLSGSYKQNSSSPVEFTIWTDKSDVGELFDLAMRYRQIAWFEGNTERGKPIWLMGLEINQIIGKNRMQGSASIYIEGDFDSIPPDENEIFIRASLSPTPLIIPDVNYSLNYDGTISKIKDEPRIPIEWNSSHGGASLSHEYEYMFGKREADQLIAQLRKNILRYKYRPKVETDLKAVLLEFTKWIDDEILLLSMIGRKRIVCYEATASHKDDSGVRYALARYKTWQGFHTLPTDLSLIENIIRPTYLKDGLFGTLLQNYLNSPYKDVIRRTIPNLITTYEDGYIESHLSSAYSALESMVDGIGDIEKITYSISSNPFKRLTKKIKELLNTEIEDQVIRESIKNKIPELRRRSFQERLFALLEIQNVSMDMIWPPDTDQDSEFHNLIKRRNLLIHQGQVENRSMMIFDLSRVQRLVELWILRLLNCPSGAINTYGLWRDAPINKVLHY
jgi:hypothetical protein